MKYKETPVTTTNTETAKKSKTEKITEIIQQTRNMNIINNENFFEKQGWSQLIQDSLYNYFTKANTQRHSLTNTEYTLQITAKKNWYLIVSDKNDQDLLHIGLDRKTMSHFEINHRWLHKSLRGQGVMSHVIKNIQKSLQQAGSFKITLQADQRNVIRFFMKHGFQLIPDKTHEKVFGENHLPITEEIAKQILLGQKIEGVYEKKDATKHQNKDPYLFRQKDNKPYKTILFWKT